MHRPRMWLEVCTNSEKDWRATMLLCAKTFQHSPFAQRFLPDPVKRKLFLPHYFNYHFESKYAHGRAGLVCLKILEPEMIEPKVILGCVIHFKTDMIREADQSLMFKAYESGASTILKRDEWYEKKIHEPMRKFAKSLGLVAFHGAYQAVDNAYRAHGLGSKYMMEAYQLLYTEGMNQLKNEGNDSLDAMVYGIHLDVALSASKFLRSIDSASVAHLHYNYKPGLKCIRDTDLKEDDEFSCVTVGLWKQHSKHDHLVPKLKKLFNVPDSQL